MTHVTLEMGKGLRVGDLGIISIGVCAVSQEENREGKRRAKN